MERFDFYGVRFSAANMNSALEFVHNYDFDKPGYFSFPDSSVVAMASKDDYLRDILNHATLTLPDGKPSQIVARRQGFSSVSTVSGYWLCQELLKNGRYSHYFLGSTPAKLDLIQKKIENDFPQANVLGYHSPPFKTAEDFRNGYMLENALNEINQLQPDLIWIGLSSPKQDYLIHSHVSQLNRGIFLGVGGVFDYLSGEVAKSPEWVKKIGLRWLWRLIKEPKRLGPKYWQTIKFFVFGAYQKSNVKKNQIGR